MMDLLPAFETHHTKNYTLLQLTAENYQAFLKVASDQEIMNLIGLSEDQMATERKKGEFGFRTHNKSYLVFLIVDPKTAKTIGFCGFHVWYLEHNRAEIGYGLYCDQYKGKGVMSEVIASVMAYGFNEMGLERIEAFIGPENQASLNLVEKFNFQREGHLRKHYFTNDELEDSVVYSLLKTEYAVAP